VKLQLDPGVCFRVVLEDEVVVDRKRIKGEKAFSPLFVKLRIQRD